MAWYLNRALTNFRNAVNMAYPNRDKTSDGTVGDLAHQATSSDHNPDPAGEPDAGSVDAWDMDVELNGPGRAYTEDVEHLKRVFQAHESSRYWIHNRQIASRSDGWVRRPYTGTNPHDKHVHFNTRESHENSTAPWPIREDDDMEQADTLAYPTGLAGRRVGHVLADLENLRNYLIGAGPAVIGDASWPKPDSPLAVLVAAAKRPPAAVDVPALAAALAEAVTPLLQPGATPEQVDAIVRQVVAAYAEGGAAAVRTPS